MFRARLGTSGAKNTFGETTPPTRWSRNKRAKQVTNNLTNSFLTPFPTHTPWNSTSVSYSKQVFSVYVHHPIYISASGNCYLTISFLLTSLFSRPFILSQGIHLRHGKFIAVHWAVSPDYLIFDGNIVSIRVSFNSFHPRSLEIGCGIPAPH